MNQLNVSICDDVHDPVHGKPLCLAALIWAASLVMTVAAADEPLAKITGLTHLWTIESGPEPALCTVSPNCVFSATPWPCVVSIRSLEGKLLHHSKRPGITVAVAATPNGAMAVEDSQADAIVRYQLATRMGAAYWNRSIPHFALPESPVSAVVCETTIWLHLPHGVAAWRNDHVACARQETESELTAISGLSIDEVISVREDGQITLHSFDKEKRSLASVWSLSSPGDPVGAVHMSDHKTLRILDASARICGVDLSTGKRTILRADAIVGDLSCAYERAGLLSVGLGSADGHVALVPWDPGQDAVQLRLWECEVVSVAHNKEYLVASNAEGAISLLRIDRISK